MFLLNSSPTPLNPPIVFCLISRRPVSRHYVEILSKENLDVVRKLKIVILKKLRGFLNKTSLTERTPKNFNICAWMKLFLKLLVDKDVLKKKRRWRIIKKTEFSGQEPSVV